MKLMPGTRCTDGSLVRSRRECHFWEVNRENFTKTVIIINANGNTYERAVHEDEIGEYVKHNYFGKVENIRPEKES